MSFAARRWLKALSSPLQWHPSKGVGIPRGGALRWVGGEGAEALDALSDYLWWYHFCGWSGPPGETYGHGAEGLPTFADGIESAVADRCYWERGWRVLATEPQWAFVTDGLVSVFLPHRQGMQPPDAVAGEPVAVELSCARRNLESGMFCVVGQGGLVRRTEPYLVLAIHLAPEGAAPLARAIACHSRPLAIEARLVNDPARYHRVDTAHLYTAPEGFPDAWRLVAALQRRHPRLFRRGVLPFARELSRGVAVAEMPATAPGAPAEGFARQRSRLVAGALLEAWRAGDPASAWEGRLRTAFEREGISPAAPYVQHLRVREGRRGPSFLRPRPATGGRPRAQPPSVPRGTGPRRWTSAAPSRR